MRRERKENTARKTVRNAKTMFRFAVKQGLVSSNPFEQLKGATIRSDDNRMLVERETIAKVLAKVKDPTKRLLIALARYGGS
jgi:site-specific recombinase XerD